MKERPIIFTAESVRAILAGQKTMTRRVVKPQPHVVYGGVMGRFRPDADNRLLIHNGEEEVLITCPYGKPGDRLWVRETWAGNVAGCPNGLTYRADHTDPKGDGPANPIKWSPSIFMPRWASRLTLEIVGARVERLQDITEADIKAEGVLVWDKAMRWDAREAFACLWDSINAKRGYPWESNPWVWAITFRRLP